VKAENGEFLFSTKQESHKEFYNIFPEALCLWVLVLKDSPIVLQMPHECKWLRFEKSKGLVAFSTKQESHKEFYNDFFEA
jgi:hypothetical protein